MNGCGACHQNIVDPKFVDGWCVICKRTPDQVRQAPGFVYLREITTTVPVPIGLLQTLLDAHSMSSVDFAAMREVQALVDAARTALVHTSTYMGVDMASGPDHTAYRLCLCECPESDLGQHRPDCPALLRGWRCAQCNNILYNDWVSSRDGEFCTLRCSARWRIDKEASRT